MLNCSRTTSRFRSWWTPEGSDDGNQSGFEVPPSLQTSLWRDLLSQYYISPLADYSTALSQAFLDHVPVGHDLQTAVRWLISLWVHRWMDAGRLGLEKSFSLPWLGIFDSCSAQLVEQLAGQLVVEQQPGLPSAGGAERCSLCSSAHWGYAGIWNSEC